MYYDVRIKLFAESQEEKEQDLQQGLTIIFSVLGKYYKVSEFSEEMFYNFIAEALLYIATGHPTGHAVPDFLLALLRKPYKETAKRYVQLVEEEETLA